MSPYDAGWSRPRPAESYDRSFGGRGSFPARQDGGFRYDGGFRPQPGRGPMVNRTRMEEDARFPSGEMGNLGSDAWEGEVIYGPARYGLGPYHERLRSRRRPDDELKAEVEEALFYDTWVDAEAITVEVRDGVVTLRGELPDYDEIRYATDDAWDVDGVHGVRSELTLRAGHP